MPRQVAEGERYFCCCDVRCVAAGALRCWPELRVPKTRHLKLRFLGFYRPELGKITHFVQITTKMKICESETSVTYRLGWESPPIPIFPVRVQSRRIITQPRYALLNNILAGMDVR